ARLLLERLDQSIGGLDVLAVVQRDRRPRRRSRAPARGEDHSGGQQTGEPRQGSVPGRFPHEVAPLRASRRATRATSVWTRILGCPNILGQTSQLIWFWVPGQAPTVA